MLRAEEVQTPAGVSVCIAAGSATRMNELGDKGTWTFVNESSCAQATIDLRILSLSVFSISVIACITLSIHVTHACQPLGFAQMSVSFVL